MAFLVGKMMRYMKCLRLLRVVKRKFKTNHNVYSEQCIRNYNESALAVSDEDKKLG